MAKENIAFLVNLRKNIVEGSKMEGRYYPEAESKEALTTKGFAKHVADHGGMVSYEFMQLVLAAIVKCLKEMISHGQPVKLDGLGTFRPTVTSVPGGAASVEDALRMGVNNLVQGVNFVFIPENAQGEEITSKKFKDQCSLQFAYLVETRRSTARTSPTRCVPRCRLGISSSRMRATQVPMTTVVPMTMAVPITMAAVQAVAVASSLAQAVTISHRVIKN